MRGKFSKVYRFRIDLNEIDPIIWRQIEVPENFTFWDLHVAIQDAMGWKDCHLHEFDVINPRTEKCENIGITDEESEWVLETLTGWKILISEYFNAKNPHAVYTYDFGDKWTHLITLEAILAVFFQKIYPCCISGARACPPEDVGGVIGYYNFLTIIENPNHKLHQKICDRFGTLYNPG